MSKFYVLFVAFLGSITLMSCTKQPIASFSTNKSVYNGGETVYLKNSSVDADSYMWVLPNQSPSYSRDAQYLIPANMYGNLEFTLIAYSKNKKRESSTSRTVQVNLAKGNATFWMSSGQYIVTVSLQNMTNKITKKYNSNPGCGADGCANFNGLTPGTYSFYATDNYLQWNGNITINPNNCSTMQLTLGKGEKVENPIYEPLRIESEENIQ